MEEIFDVDEAYSYLNEFKTQDGLWQWNSDDITKTIFNTNDSNTIKFLIRDTALDETAK